MIVSFDTTQETRTCTKCGETKAVTGFYERGLRCKACIKFANRERYLKERTARLEQAKAYRSAPNYSERQAKSRRDWYYANRDYQLRYFRERTEKFPRERMVMRARERADKEGLPFDLTAEDLEMPTHCPALGIPLVMGTGKPGDGSPSLDRIVPELGYVKGNVRVISYRANTIKQDATPDEILAVARWAERETLRVRGGACS